MSFRHNADRILNASHQITAMNFNTTATPIPQFRAMTRIAGYSSLECLMLIPPISTCVFSFLNTPDYLCLRNSSQTMRCFVENNRRFFRNLVFLKRGGEKLLDMLESNADNAFNGENQSLVVSSVVHDILETREQREWRKKELEDQMINFLIQNMSTVSDEWRHLAVEAWHEQSLKVKEQVNEFSKRLVKPVRFDFSDYYHPRLMGRHLSQIINNLPIGRNVTSIVLDGTGVDTLWIQLVMTRFASTLRGLSVRNCENIDAYIFPDWLLDCLYRHYPISLRWLRVWGIGNLPNFLNSCGMLEGVMPLTPHPDDAWAVPPNLVHQTSKLLANLMLKDFNVSYVRRLLCPMFKYGQEKRFWLRDMENLLNAQYAEYETRHRENTEPFPRWNAPLNPLGDINPVISLLALSRNMDIQLDFSLCAAQHFCWSFVLAGEEAPLDLNRPAMFQVNIGPNTFQLPQRVGDDQEVLHTHSLAEIGARTSEGGQCCHVCGLWEGVPSPFEYCDGDEITDLGGIKTGNGIGGGRYSIGNLCIDCRKMQTCGECGKFVCHNCCFANPAAPQNPLMTMDPPEVQYLKFICEQHGAECVECVSTRPENYFECDECGLGLCLRCEPPFGTNITTDLYGGEMDFMTMSDFDTALKLPYAKKSSFFRSRFCRLKAFKPLLPQDPDDMKGLLTLAEARQFEFCDGCDSTICIHCIGKLQAHRPTPSRPTTTLYTSCREGCGSVFCEQCEKDFASKCKSCGVYVCDECDWEMTMFDVPHELEKEWCRAPGCMEKAGTSKLDDLRGPWEDGWDGPSPFVEIGPQLEDPLVIMVNALKESGHLPDDLLVQDFIAQYQGADDGVLGALGRAAELLSSQPGSSLSNIVQQQPYSSQLRSSLNGNSGGVSRLSTSGTVLEELEDLEDLDDYHDENYSEPDPAQMRLPIHGSDNGGDNHEEEEL